MKVLSFAEEAYIRAIESLLAAEIEEAEAFLARKYENANKPRSDWEARAMALIDTKGATTRFRAMADIYLNRMRREADAADPA